jgi:hypothetical protein
MMPIYSNLNPVSDFIVNNKALNTIKSITSESTKEQQEKILLILADSITSDVVLNDGLFNTRSITIINLRKPRRDQLADAALRL